MNSQRRPPRPPDADVDPRWWYVPATIIGVALLAALGAFIALPATETIALAPALSQEFPLPSELPGDNSVPDAGSVDYAHDAAPEQPATF